MSGYDRGHQGYHGMIGRCSLDCHRCERQTSLVLIHINICKTMGPIVVLDLLTPFSQCP